MKKRKKFKMLFIFKKRKRQDSKNNLRNKMSKRNYKIIIVLSKKIK